MLEAFIDTVKLFKWGESDSLHFLMQNVIVFFCKIILDMNSDEFWSLI